VPTIKTSTPHIATIAVVILLSAGATRLIEHFVSQWVNLTTVTGGGIVTFSDLVSGDSRSITVSLLKLIIPGVLIQALLVKGGLQMISTLRVPYVQTAVVLFLFNIGTIALEQLIAREFRVSQGLHALTIHSQWTWLLSIVLTAAVLVFEASVIGGISRLPVGKYPKVVYARRIA
jgi:hypothetical protein